MRDGDVIPGLNLNYVRTLLANQRLIVLRDWAQGRTKDEDLAMATKTAFLIMARGFTRGLTQARLAAELKKLLRAAES